MRAVEDAPRIRRRMTGLWRSPRAVTRLGVALLLLGLAAACIGRRVLFDLRAEDPDRSVYRFASGAAEVEVTTQMPWSRVPAVLPGSADAWTSPSAHAVSMRVELARPRALLLYVQPGRVRLRELPRTFGQPEASPGRLRILANRVSIGVFDTPGLGRRVTDEGTPAPPRIELALPAAALGDSRSLRITLVNEGPHGIGLRRVRLIEALPSLSLGHLARGGRFPLASGGFLAIGLGLLLRARLQRAADGRGGRPVRRALGPGLGLLVLGLAVAAPVATRSVPHFVWLLLLLGVLPLGRRPPRPANVPRAWPSRLARGAGNGLLALCALVVAVAAGEFALRMVFGEEPWARLVLHTPVPAPATVGLVNSLGFNEREFPLDKPAGVYRIAVLGDSLSVSAPRGQRFGDVIVDRLNAQPSKSVAYEAVSFGRAGIDTNVETEILQGVVWRTKPDFILLEFYVNDLENGDHSGRPEDYPLIPGENAVSRWLRRLTDHMLLRKMLEEQSDALQERLGLAETYPAYMYDRFGDPAGAHWQTAAYELRNFIRECRKHQTPLAIALFPHLSAGLPAGAYEFDELYDQVLDLCRQENVPCVDLRSTYAPYRDYTSLWLTRFDPHPNARAHRLAAERLVEVLGPFWLAAGRAAGGRGAPGLTAGAGVSRAAAPDSAASRSRRS
jgi:lysophospholipase L1-like esterase